MGRWWSFKTSVAKWTISKLKSDPYTRNDYRPTNDGLIHFTFEWWHLWILKRFQYVSTKIELVWKSIQHRLVSNRKSMHYACNKILIEVISHMPKSVTCKKKLCDTFLYSTLQVVSANSVLVGCGFAICGTTRNYVCNYGPA